MTMMMKMRLLACILLLSAQYLCGANRLRSPQQRKLDNYGGGGGQAQQDMANVEADPAFRDRSNGHQVVATYNWSTQSSNTKAVPAPPQADGEVYPGIVDWWNTPPSAPPVQVRDGAVHQADDEEPVPPGVINWWNTPPTTPTPPTPAPVADPVPDPTNPPVAADPVPEPTNPPVAADAVPERTNPPVAAGVVNWWNQPPTSPTTPAPATPVTTPAPMDEILFEQDSIYPGSGTIQNVGNNDDNDPNYELGRCEGDCDNDGGTYACMYADMLWMGECRFTVPDDDQSWSIHHPHTSALLYSLFHTECFGDMVCYERDGELTLVPGCVGLGEPGEDYCIDPLDNPSNHNEDTFRLKLFWRDYYWQEEDFERAWCMQCDGSSCQRGDKVRVSECDSGNEMFRFINQENNEVQIYLADFDLCLESRSGERDLKVEECDNSESQRFWPGPEGDFMGDRFELSPIWSRDECLTQRHHPKEGEKIYREDCEAARQDTTAFWNKY